MHVGEVGVGHFGFTALEKNFGVAQFFMIVTVSKYVPCTFAWRIQY